MKKYLGFAFFFLFVFLAVLVFKPNFRTITTDSGWDSSYDSGSSSSWDSGSSWDSDYDSSWSHDSSSSHSSSTSGEASSGVFFIIIFFLFVAFAVYFALYSSKNKYAAPDAIRSSDHTELVQKFFPQYSEEQLITILYGIFVKVQEAWMNFDYDALGNLCGDELFNSYKRDLEVLKLKNGQNVMNDFSLLSASIRNIEEKDGQIVIDMYLRSSFYDYVIDTRNKSVIRGTKSKKIINAYDLNFAVHQDIKDTCPNCGAKLTSRECEFCHTVVPNENSSFVLIKKGRFGE